MLPAHIPPDVNDKRGVAISALDHFLVCIIVCFFRPKTFQVVNKKRVPRRFEQQLQTMAETNAELSARVTELSEGRIRLEAQLRCAVSKGRLSFAFSPSRPIA